jgi:ABC-type dipeptide/oligopeptide/nickel transport system permease component
MALPCLTVALALSAVLIRNLRASLLMEMNSDYVVAARGRADSGNAFSGGTCCRTRWCRPSICWR